MTKREALIISAYTGYLMCDMSELHKFIEETLGRAIYTHELADDETLNELRDKVRDEFLKIVTNACDESNAEVAEVKHGRWSSNSIAIVCSCRWLFVFSSQSIILSLSDHQGRGYGRAFQL